MNTEIKLDTIYHSTYPHTAFWKVVKITPKTIVLRQMDHTRTDKFINRERGDKIERWEYWVYKCGDAFEGEKTKIIKKTDYFGYEEGTEYTREYGLSGIYTPDELPDVVSPEEDDEDDGEDIDDDDICDCCVKGWDKENEFGRCSCWCSSCGELLRDCKYKCM